MSAVLEVFLGDSLIHRVKREDVPKNERFSFPIPKENASLSFVASSGKTYRHDLQSAVKDGWSWIHLSVMVSDVFGVGADALLGNSDNPPEAEFRTGMADGMRFQPISLPEMEGGEMDLSGQGLFQRGFHKSGVVTPANLTLSCICDFCEKSFRLQSLHAGFEGITYMYCSGGPHTLFALKTYPDAPPVFGPPDLASVERFEARLPECLECGGNFKYYNSFLCPHCSKPYIDFERFPYLRELEYYANYLYDGSVQQLNLP